MAQIDRAHRRLEVKLVYWGPAFGGKTTTLRSLHGRCPPEDRGELTSIETEEERTYCFDYAPLRLPRYRDFELRMNAYTVPGQEVYVNTRLRILRGASAVVFVADSTPTAREANERSWRQLEEALQSIEAVGRPIPVVLSANKQDLPEALGASDVLRQLRSAVPSRRPHAVHETVALSGKGVVASFRDALIAALEQTVAGIGVDGGRDGEDERFLAALEAQIGGLRDGVPVSASLPRQQVRVGAVTRNTETDPAVLANALATNAMLADREFEVRDMRKESAHGRLLADLGHICLAATAVDSLVRSVLATLVVGLDGTAGWVGLTLADSHTVYGTLSSPSENGAVAQVVRPLLGAASEDRPVRIGPETLAALPLPAGGARGVLVPFAGPGCAGGWLLLVGLTAVGFPTSAESVLVTTGAFLGLALARLAALRQLQSTNTELEQRVAARTQELQEEKNHLELRVRERTRELEDAKRATVEAERRLLDRERTEGVRQLAAGLAHEVNNPVGAVRANLEFVSDGLERIRSSNPGLAAAVDELAEAVKDARADVERVTASVRTLFDAAAASRRAMHRTPLAPVVRDTLAAYAAAAAPGHPPRLVERDGIVVGVQPAECSRWLFRALTSLTRGGSVAPELEIASSEDGPTLTIVVRDAPPCDAEKALSTVAAELATCGGRLALSRTPQGVQVRFTYPRAPGETRSPSGFLEAGAR